MVRNLKLLYYSAEESDIRSLSLSSKKIISILFLSGLVFVGLSGVSAYMGMKYYENVKITQLKHQNGILISQLSNMEQKASVIEDRLKGLESFDNELRIVADLPKLDEDVRGVGVGGFASSFVNRTMDELPSPLNEQARIIAADLAELDRRIDLEFSSFNEIESKLQNDKKKIRHTPTITPVEGLLKSPFGNRVDPFEDIIRHHDGIDIAAEKGTAVNSPADGVIRVVNTRDIRKGYGRYIIIDHGDNVLTLFGHLSNVLVKSGQRVKRRDVIGEVGRTGRATGYHLHYEVMVNGVSKDPTNYIHDSL